MSNFRALQWPTRNHRKCRQSFVVDRPRPAWRNHLLIGQVLLRGAIPLENITFDVDELSRLDKIEQAQRLEEAARRIDEVQRAAADDNDLMQWVERQRQYLVDMQHLIYEC